MKRYRAWWGREGEPGYREVVFECHYFEVTLVCKLLGQGPLGPGCMPVGVVSA